ncbi:MAG: hypothetical protein N4A63_14095 [Vallitalea sp.]|jgi:hypothetical protein|nr:hypothetical protein [Vallitalea sp.]
MKKIRVTKESILGCSLIVVSGLIFTFERYVSIFMWIGQVAPVKIKGSGSWPSKPTMPGFFDNIFVPLLFIMGLFFVIISFKYHEDNKAN